MSPKMKEWLLFFWAILVGALCGFMFGIRAAHGDSAVLSFGPTLNGNTNPKMAGIGYEHTWANASLLAECRGIFSSPINGACGLTLSARVETSSGMFIRVGAGPAYYFRVDDRVSSNWNANLQGAVGLTQGGWAIGVLWVHYSNAGLVPPNLGRDFIGPVVEIGLCKSLFPGRRIKVFPLLMAGALGFAGSKMAADAAGNAADKQAGAARYATDLQRDIFTQTRSDYQPWREAGVQALYGTGGMFRRKDGGSGVALDMNAAKESWIKDRMTKEREKVMNSLSPLQRKKLGDKIMADMSDDRLRAKMEADWNAFGHKEVSPGIDANQYEIDPEFTRNFTMADFQADPSYQFRMNEGMKARERSAAARGGLNSGRMMKELERYGQDLASTEYTNAYNRFNADRDRRFGRLSQLAGIGQTATGQLSNASQNYASNVGNIAMSNANAQGAAGIAQANAWGSGLSGLGKTWMDYTMMNKYGDGGDSGGGAGGGGSYRTARLGMTAYRG